MANEARPRERGEEGEGESERVEGCERRRGKRARGEKDESNAWGTNGTTRNGETRGEGKGNAAEGRGRREARGPRGRRTGPRSRSRTARGARRQHRRHLEYVRGGGRRTLPHATLALSEYSEMATFSSTRWSAKLSGLRASAHARRQRRSHAACARGELERDAPVSHGADEDADRVRVGDRREVVAQADGLGVEREGCRVSERQHDEQKRRAAAEGRTDLVALAREVVRDRVLRGERAGGVSLERPKRSVRRRGVRDAP